jgi:Subtilase family
MRSDSIAGVFGSSVTPRPLHTVLRAAVPALVALVALLAVAPAARAVSDGLPMQLPGDAMTADAGSADPSTWLVGATPGSAADALARRFGAARVGLPQTGGFVVARARARDFADALRARHLLVYAQANVYVHPDAVTPDPLSATPWDWRSRVADPSLTPPPVTPASPLIALVDVAADMTHPEWTNDPSFTTVAGTPVTSAHGTATAAVAAAPANGIGILGVWPGARALNVPLQTEPGTNGDISCAASADAISKAIAAKAAVINMSYGSTAECAAEKVQIYYAVAEGIVPVAAAGNDFEQGNPLEFPASLPHVMTVAATDQNDQSADFSSASDAVDLSAPGVAIETAVPPQYDSDGTPDGYQQLSGTSFSAPMVSAAIAWVRAARPSLAADQAAAAVRLSARDVGKPGWDALTGFGVLDVGAALSLPQSKIPIHDPLEPNDNLVWVDGRAFNGKPTAPIWKGGSAIRLNALLDKEEDPVDAYRVVVPPHSKAKISVIPRFGDIEAETFNSSAISINDTHNRIAKSALAGASKTEHLTLDNGGTREHAYYVVVMPQGSSAYQDRQYTLRVGPASS